MTVAVMEVYDALRSAGVAEEPARRAAEAMGGVTNRNDRLEGRLDTVDNKLDRLETDVQALNTDVQALKTDVVLLKWMIGANLGLTLLVLGKLLLP